MAKRMRRRGVTRKGCGCPRGAKEHSTAGGPKVKDRKTGKMRPAKPRGPGFVCVASAPSPFGGKKVTRFVSPVCHR